MRAPNPWCAQCSVGAGGVWKPGGGGLLVLGVRFSGSFLRVMLRASLGPASLYLRRCGVSYLVNSGGVSHSFDPHSDATR